MRTAWRVFRAVLIGLVIVGFAAAAIGAAFAYRTVQLLSEDLPPIGDERYRPKLTSRVLDRNGVLLATLHEEEIRSRLVPVAEIPRLTRLAFIAVEDERFYDHYGIDPKAILRAAFKNFKAGGVVEGGSTLTQQLAKNRFLKPERTLRRKIQEVILAFRLERAFSKEEILGQYLNEIFFGKGMYGISSASQYYFGKKVGELSLAESAILAGLPKAPNRFTPGNNTLAYKDRQKVVLTKMWEQGYITKEEMLKAVAEPIRFHNRLDKQLHVEGKADYFLALVKKKLIEMYGVRQVYTGGLKVTTTLDYSVQQLAEKHFIDAAIFKGKPIDKFPALQGGMVVLDPANGDVKAMIGGRDFDTNQYNRAVQARRQPGSAFKPFVYTAALLQGMQPNALINDEPVRYEDPKKKGKDRFWEPHNFGDVYHGPTILAKALAGSYNIVAVRLLEQIGVQTAIDLARRMGISTPLEPYLPLALGSSDVTLIEMVSAYGVFANQGIRATPRAILKIEDYDGRVLFQADPEEKEVLDENTAFLATHMMRGVVERGSATKARVPGHAVAGKTGTSNRFVDAWFIGFTPEVVAGCFIGNDDRKPLGLGKAGGEVAAPIVGAFLKEYLKSRRPRDFKKPEGVEIVTVCTDSGAMLSTQCPEKWTIAFAKGGAPKAPCTLHVPLDAIAMAAETSTAEVTGEAEFSPLIDEEALVPGTARRAPVARRANPEYGAGPLAEEPPVEEELAPEDQPAVEEPGIELPQEETAASAPRRHVAPAPEGDFQTEAGQEPVDDVEQEMFAPRGRRLVDDPYADDPEAGLDLPP